MGLLYLFVTRNLKCWASNTCGVINMELALCHLSGARNFEVAHRLKKKVRSCIRFQFCCLRATHHRELCIGFIWRKTGFNPRSVHVDFVVGKIKIGTGFVFPPQCSDLSVTVISVLHVRSSVIRIRYPSQPAV